VLGGELPILPSIKQLHEMSTSVRVASGIGVSRNPVRSTANRQRLAESRSDMVLYRW